MNKLINQNDLRGASKKEVFESTALSGLRAGALRKEKKTSS